MIEVWRALDRHSGWLLVIGLTAAVVVNWLQWNRDRKATQRSDTNPYISSVPSQAPRVSILVPAWNEARNIGPCMESLMSLRYPNKEIVVCAGGSDGTLAIAQRYAGPDVIVLEQRPGEGKQRALQRALEQSTGTIIFLTDADCLLDDGCFQRTLAPLLIGEEEVATGSWMPLDEQRGNSFVNYQWLHHIYREGTLPEYIDSLDGRNAAIQRAALERVGGFNLPAPIGTDYHLSHLLTKAGYRIRFVRGSRVRTRYPETVREYWKQQSRWFRSAFLLSARFGAWKRALTSLRASLAALFMLSVPLISLWSSVLWYLWIAALVHLILAQARLIGFARLAGEEPITPRWRYLLFFVYMPIGWIAMARGLVESLLPSRRERW